MSEADSEAVDSLDSNVSVQPRYLTCFDIFWYGFYLLCGITLGRYVTGRYNWILGVVCGVAGTVLSVVAVMTFSRLLPDNLENDTVLTEDDRADVLESKDL